MEARTYTSTLEESAIVERVARIVSSVRGSKPDYIRLAAELEQAIPFDVFGVALLRHDRQAVRVSVCQRDGGAWIVSHHQHPSQGSKLETLLESPALMVSAYPGGLDGPPAETGDALSSYHQLHSTVIAPLVVEDRVLGALELGSVSVNTYADETLQRLVSAVAGVLATAIESAQLGGSAAIQDRQRQALKDVSSALTSKIDLPTILNQIVVGIANALNVASIIVMLDRSRQRVFLEAQSGLDKEAASRLFEPGLPVGGKCLISRTLQERQSCVSPDIVVEEEFSESARIFGQLGIHSVLSYPLAIGATAYGALLLCSTEPGGFTPLKTEILSLFASQATVAIYNGMLLESAQQRRRFQEAIERLEQARVQNVVDSLHPGMIAESAAEATGGQQQSEAELLAAVREEAQRTFGVSLTSLLRFISDHLLTLGERDLQTILSAHQSAPASEASLLPLADPLVRSALHERMPVSLQGMRVQDQEDALADTLSLLTQTAETALLRTDMISALSQLLMQLNQPNSGVKDAWFVVSLQGICIYMNPTAEALCEIHLEDMSAVYNARLLAVSQSWEDGPTIERIFAKLLPRIRNDVEVQRYLQDFTQDSIYRQELRCIVAAEPVHGQASGQESMSRRSFLLAESASSDYHYQFKRYPLCNAQGQLGAIALQVQDVTEQVRDEHNRSVLLSSVSHDLRTPLTTIKAAVTGLLQTDVAWSEQDRQAMLEDIDAETDHLTVLVSALVELSRIEMGALVLEKEWCDVVEVVHGVLAKMERVLANRPVLLRFQPGLPLIYVDHAQLERVFYNLIENAARRSPERAEIVITLEIVDDMLRAQVIDRGGGVPEPERERIFKSFYSLGPYGNALGLAICKGILEAHQGRIEMQASADGDSCFAFTLPVHPHAGGQRETRVIASPASPGSTLADESASSF
jgi:signal transduction histidine kinase/GAF domain-containing protein